MPGVAGHSPDALDPSDAAAPSQGARRSFFAHRLDNIGAPRSMFDIPQANFWTLAGASTTVLGRISRTLSKGRHFRETPVGCACRHSSHCVRAVRKTAGDCDPPTRPICARHPPPLCGMACHPTIIFPALPDYSFCQRTRHGHHDPAHSLAGVRPLYPDPNRGAVPGSRCNASLGSSVDIPLESSYSKRSSGARY